MIENAHIEKRTNYFVVDNDTGKVVNGWWSNKEIAEVALDGRTAEAMQMEFKLD